MVYLCHAVSQRVHSLLHQVERSSVVWKVATYFITIRPEILDEVARSLLADPFMERYKEDHAMTKGVDDLNSLIYHSYPSKQAGFISDRMARKGYL
jgi:hypothetical protein